MKKLIQHIKLYTFGWLIASIFFYILRQVGIDGVNEISLTIPQFILYLPLFAIVPGLLFGSLQYLFEIKSKVKRNLPLQLFRMFILQIITITVLTVLFFIEEAKYNFRDVLFSGSVFVFNLYVFVVNIILAFLVEIINLTGRENFIKLITGKFYSPKEEYRVFMFIDLKSSTTIAEKLGHLAYSRFIKDCFSDLDVVTKYHTEIYQYVGDEVVFTWNYRKVKSLIQCIDAFWAYRERLKSRFSYYDDKYGVHPEFKAGMSLGLVTVVEIGDFKKEIAYHGPTLNTTSRVVDLCNQYGEKLLITKKVFDLVNKNNSKYKYDKVTEVELRGTTGLTEIYSVHENGVTQ